MCHALAHRGPDGEGICAGEGFALGHRRLAVIDVEGGAQPLISRDGKVSLVANGEIYNFRDLRKELEQAGAVFQTNSDSETILHLYCAARGEWDSSSPEKILSRLEGMFAFAIYDADTKRLFCARDRLGQKPFFYSNAGSIFAFASELSALARMKEISPNLSRDDDATAHYFKYGYIPAPLTIYREIRKLLPAHYLLYENAKIAIRRYWDLPPPGETDCSYEEILLREFEDLLSQAVKKRLVSEVPLGAFLSGGLDSSVIAALMRQAGQVKTFSLGFADSSYDESASAQTVAKFLQTEHHAETATVSVRELLPRMAEIFGEPFGDSSAANVWLLSEMTRRHVTVALSGDGADELLAGYRRHAAQAWSNYYRKIPRLLRCGGERFFKMLPVSPGYYGDSVIKKARLFCEQAERLESDPLALATMPFSAEATAHLLPSLSGEDDLIRQAAEKWRECEPVEQMLRVDLQTYLPDDILVKVDRMSMAHGLEARSPFLDHKLVEFCCRLPMNMKLLRLTGKYLLRQCGKKILPAAIIKRKKHGFMLPLDRWLKTDLRQPAQDATLSLDPALFNRADIETLWQEHLANRADHSHRLWLLWTWSQWAGVG
jgi:asparagine synthase (glutamine-hydrolysing)